ncbi:MAG: PIN domain-containing protein [Agriterribacter sp.]
MRIFLDANILVSVLNKEYPLYQYSSKLLSLCGYKNFIVCTSPVCLAIAFYFAEKKHGSQVARSKIGILLEHITVTDCGATEARLAIQNKKAQDFEDALQYYSALHAQCKCIVTTDTDDFFYADKMEIIEPDQFLMKYVK